MHNSIIKSDLSIIRFATTFQFLALAKDSKGRNRGPSVDLLKQLDPNGIHVLGYQFFHNDVEWRGCWLCKFDYQDSPVKVWMDNSTEAYDTFTSLEEVSSIEGCIQAV